MMFALPVVARIQRLGLVVAASLAFLPALLTRLLMGEAFFLTGRGKLEHLDNVVQFFTTLGIPMPELNAAFVSRLEFYGGIALVLGLATRLVAAGLASTMVVALLTADKQPFLDALRLSGEQTPTDIVPAVYLSFLLWLVIGGPGALSLDRLIARLWRKEQPAEPGIPVGEPIRV
ncbi:MAG TPA: DoxX family protein [Vicinamibacteria bacterium]